MGWAWRWSLAGGGSLGAALPIPLSGGSSTFIVPGCEHVPLCRWGACGRACGWRVAWAQEMPVSAARNHVWIVNPQGGMQI